MQSNRPHTGSMETIVAIVGPTASGKTELALLLAERLNAEIISADSRQVYRLLDVGTAKPSLDERKGIVHHFLDILDPKEEYSAGAYGKEARAVLRDMQNRGKPAVIVGGSGLYVQALIDGFFDGPGKDPEIRGRLEREYLEGGIQGILESLRGVDPESAQSMESEPKPRRIMRALEVYYATGKPLSRHRAEQTLGSVLNTTKVGILWERAALYERIDQRVSSMMKMGFLEEVASLRTMGYTPDLNALNTVGYKELFEHLAGRISLTEAVESIKRNTRRFAKRQMTWFRRDQRIQWIRPGIKMEDVASGILATLEKGGLDRRN